MPLKIFKKAAAHQPLIKIIECQIKKPCLVSKKNTGAIREKTYTYVLKSNHFLGDADSGIARHKHQVHVKS